MVGAATGVPMAEVARPSEEFFYLSQLLSRRVVSRDGERVDRLVDLGCAANEVFPRVLTYYVRPGLLAPVTLAVPAPALCGRAERDAQARGADRRTADIPGGGSPRRSSSARRFWTSK